MFTFSRRRTRTDADAEPVTQELVKGKERGAIRVRTAARRGDRQVGLLWFSKGSNLAASKTSGGHR